MKCFNDFRNIPYFENLKEKWLEMKESSESYRGIVVLKKISVNIYFKSNLKFNISSKFSYIFFVRLCSNHFKIGELVSTK